MSSSKNLEYKKTAFLSKSNNAFIEEMYMKFVNNDPALPDSWKNYFEEIGDEVNDIVNEINGPSWSPSKKFSIKQFKEQNGENNEKMREIDLIKSKINLSFKEINTKEAEKIIADFNKPEANTEKSDSISATKNKSKTKKISKK